jgi:hypothetical protein
MLIGLCLLIFTGFISDSIQVPPPPPPIREYMIQKDGVSGDKAGQFSIYSDKAESNLSYRIESYYSPMQKIDLLTYPHKKIIGQLDAHQSGWRYEATFEILDTRNASNKWLNGHIKRINKWFVDKYNIKLLERKISMAGKFASTTFKFFNEGGKLLASFKSVFHLIGPTKYVLKIYSNEFPDSIFMLILAAYDHKRTNN